MGLLFSLISFSHSPSKDLYGGHYLQRIRHPSILTLFICFIFLFSSSTSSSLLTTKQVSKLDISALQSAIGHSLLKAHDITSIDYSDHHEIQSYGRQLIVCCNQRNKNPLQLLLLQNNLRNTPIMLSKGRDQACLLVLQSPLSTLTDLSTVLTNNSLVNAWSPIFPILKISPKILELVRTPSFKKSTWSGVKIQIFYESGNLLSPLRSLDMTALIDELKNLLGSNNLFEKSTMKLKLSHNIRTRSNSWKRLLNSVLSLLSPSSSSSTSSSTPPTNLNSLCSFDKYLQYQPSSQQAYLDIIGFDSIINSLELNSQTKLLCLVALVSAGASQSESIHVTVALRPVLIDKSNKINNNANPSSSASSNANAFQDGEDGIYSPGIVQSGQNEPITGRVYDTVGLNGSNIIVGVSDTGVDDKSCYFSNDPHPPLDRYYLNSTQPLNTSFDLTQRKLVQYIAFYDGVEEYSDGHGTHVSGMVAGVPLNPSLNDGVARGAKIAFLDIGEPNGDIVFPPDDFFQFARLAGATIQCMSWGTFLPEYTYFDTYIDEEVYSSTSIPHVVILAAGNEGPNPSTINSPALSKNSLHIGGTDGINLLDFSSRGPTFDLRYGVDLLAPGVAISTKSSGIPYRQTCEVSWMMGTSISAPAVAGAAALVIQYYQDSRYWASNCQLSYAVCHTTSNTTSNQLFPVGFTPSTSLVKGTLIHSGQNIDPTGQHGYRYPGNEQGFGQVQLSSVLVIKGITPYGFDLFVDEITLSNYTHVNYTVQILGSTSPLKVTICWIDPPNSIIATKQLLNDVDLTVTDPNGVVWYGNNVTTGDEVNPTEIIEIINPIHGKYLINVSLGEMGGTSSYQNVSIIITSIGRVTNSPLTDLPSSSPTIAPSSYPSTEPTFAPSSLPTRRPSRKPSVRPTFRPSAPTTRPTLRPTSLPTTSFRPSTHFIPPSPYPTRPTRPPTRLPSSEPTLPPRNPTHRPIFTWQRV